MPLAALACDAPKERATNDGAARRSPGSRRGARLHPDADSARSRLVDAMIELARESGWDRVTTSRLYRHAGLGRRVFESQFASIEDCFEEAVETALDALLASVTAAIEGAGPAWPDRVSAAVVGFLRFLDDQPARAWMGIVEPLGGGDRARFARHRAVERLGALIADGPTDAIEGDRPRPRTAPDVVGGLWEMARQYLWDGPQACDLDDVAGSTIFLALAPYLGRRDAMRYATAVPPIAAPDRAPDERSDASSVDASSTGAQADRGERIDEPDPLAAIPVLTALAAETLGYLHDHPGAAGIDVSDAIGVGHASQTSRHLRRLEDLDLVWSQRQGHYKRWTLTERGRAVVERLRDR